MSTTEHATTEKAMSEQDVRLALWMLGDLFPIHPRPIVRIPKESAQEIVSTIDRMVPVLKAMIVGVTEQEVKV